MPLIRQINTDIERICSARADTKQDPILTDFRKAVLHFNRLGNILGYYTVHFCINNGMKKSIDAALLMVTDL